MLAPWSSMLRLRRPCAADGSLRFLAAQQRAQTFDESTVANSAMQAQPTAAATLEVAHAAAATATATAATFRRSRCTTPAIPSAASLDALWASVVLLRDVAPDAAAEIRRAEATEGEAEVGAIIRDADEASMEAERVMARALMVHAPQRRRPSRDRRPRSDQDYDGNGGGGGERGYERRRRSNDRSAPEVWSCEDDAGGFVWPPPSRQRRGGARDHRPDRRVSFRKRAAEERPFYRPDNDNDDCSIADRFRVQYVNPEEADNDGAAAGQNVSGGAESDTGRWDGGSVRRVARRGATGADFGGGGGGGAWTQRRSFFTASRVARVKEGNDVDASGLGGATPEETKEGLAALHALLWQQQEERARRAAKGASSNRGTDVSTTSPNNEASLLPPVPLAALMIVLPPDVKAFVRGNGGLVRTLRQWPQAFTISNGALEVGVAGRTAMPVLPPATAAAPAASTATSAPAASSSVGRSLRTVVLERHRRDTGTMAPALSAALGLTGASPAAGSGFATDGTFVCVYGKVDVSRPPLTRRELTARLAASSLMHDDSNGFLEGPPEDADTGASGGGAGEGDEGFGDAGDFDGGGGEELLPGQTLPDKLYRDRGMRTPREVADMYAAMCPTFSVEVRIFMRMLPPELKDPVMNPRNVPFRKPLDFFKRYPMVFTATGGNYKATTVKLAESLVHADKGRADRHFRRYALEGERPKSRAELKEEAIFECLDRNLRLVEARDGGAARFRFLRLVTFINGFGEDDLALLNSEAPERVVTVLQSRPDVFQLTGEGGEHDYRDAVEDPELPGGSRAPPPRKAQPPPAKPAASAAAAGVDVADTGPNSIASDDVVDSEAVADAVVDGGDDGTDERTPEERAEAEAAEAAAGAAGRARAPRRAVASADDLLEDDDSVPASTEPNATAEGATVDDEGASPEGKEETDATEESEQQQEGDPDLPPGVCDFYVRRRPPWLAPGSLSNYSLATSPHRGLAAVVTAVVGRPPAPAPAASSPNLRIGSVPVATAGTAVRSVSRTGTVLPNVAALRAAQQAAAAGRAAPGASTAFGVKIPSAPVAPRASAVLAPPVAPGVLSDWRWSSLDEVYARLTPAQRRELKPFRGLAAFLRLHGRAFHVTRDKSHVIAHRSDGAPPPLLATATDGDRDARRIRGADGRVPTSRAELLRLDPGNPLLDPVHLAKAIHDFLPDHPVSLARLMKRMPPLMQAAMSSRPRRFFAASPLFSSWAPSPGVFMLQKAELGPPPAGFGTDEAATVEETVAMLRSHIPPGGVPFVQLRNRVPQAARNTMRRLGGVERFLATYPQYFFSDWTVPTRPVVHKTEDVGAAARAAMADKREPGAAGGGGWDGDRDEDDAVEEEEASEVPPLQADASHRGRQQAASAGDDDWGKQWALHKQTASAKPKKSYNDGW